MPAADKRRQVANGAWYLTPIVIGNIVPIATLPIFTRILSTEDYGAWALANVYAVFIGGLAACGLPLAYERNFFQHRGSRESAQLLYSVLAFVAGAFLIGALATWVWSGPIARWMIGDVRYGSLLLWSLVTTGLVSMKGFYLTFLRNSEAAAQFARYTIAERLAGAVLSLLFVVWLRVGVIGLVFGPLLASLGVLAAIAFRFARELPPAFDRRLLAGALRLGYPLTPRTFLGVLSKNFDKYLIGQMSSLGGVGAYSVGQRIAYVPFTYATALENVFMPRVYRQMFELGDRGGSSIGRYLTPFAYASAATAFAVAIFAGDILWILTPASYHGAAPVVTILSLYYGVQFFGKVPQLTYAKRTDLIFVLSAVATALNVVFGVVCIRLWGVSGAAWGVLFAGMLSVGLGLVVGQRHYPIQWETRRLLGIYGLLFAAAAAALVLQQSAMVWAAQLAIKLGLLAAFALLGLRLGYISRENAGMVRDILLRRPASADPVEAGASA
ncbi:MAG: oligosaccharide flippase family protein [Acidobacteria bacterium]|nr:oligosaccharide flippase family protein [Acidobacteriota bacterium]